MYSKVVDSRKNASPPEVPRVRFAHGGGVHLHKFLECSNTNALMTFLRSSAQMTEMQRIGKIVICLIRRLGRLPFAYHIGRREGRHPRTSTDISSHRERKAGAWI